MTSPASNVKGVGYDPDTGNFLLANPVVPVASPTPLLGVASPDGMSGPYGPGSIVFTNSTGQDAVFGLPPMDGAGVGADMFQGVTGNPGGDFEDVGGSLNAQQVAAWNGQVQNTAVAQDVQNGDMTAAFKVLNQESAWLQSQLPSYTPDASLAKGLLIMAGAGVACSPFMSGAATALGAMATEYSGGGELGPTLKAGALSLFSAAMFAPMVKCAGAVVAAADNNNVSFAVNVLGRSAINGTTFLMNTYRDAGMQIVKSGVSPDFASSLGISASDFAELKSPSARSEFAMPADKVDLGSATSINLEALGLSASLAPSKAAGIHANFLTASTT